MNCEAVHLHKPFGLFGTKIVSQHERIGCPKKHMGRLVEEGDKALLLSLVFESQSSVRNIVDIPVFSQSHYLQFTEASIKLLIHLKLALSIGYTMGIKGELGDGFPQPKPAFSITVGSLKSTFSCF